MTESTVLLIIAIAWVTIGVTLSIVMGRRGYPAWPWLVMGAVAGPLAIVLAFTMQPKVPSPMHEVTTTHSDGGRIDVLVGVDGSPESGAALRGVTELFGDRLGRLTVATVIPYDTSLVNERDANDLLDRTAHDAGDRVERALLHGQPATALREFAVTGHYDVVTIGRVGHGLSTALLGSTATRLAHVAEPPVLLFGGTTPRAEGPERSGLAPVVTDA